MGCAAFFLQRFYGLAVPPTNGAEELQKRSDTTARTSDMVCPAPPVQRALCELAYPGRLRGGPFREIGMLLDPSPTIMKPAQ